MRPEEAEVGRRVRVNSINFDHPMGTITKVCPAKGGCLVQPDGMPNSFGWGWSELTIIQGVNYWERLARTVEELRAIGR